jgi:hypothetical protein
VSVAVLAFPAAFGDSSHTSRRQAGGTAPVSRRQFATQIAKTVNANQQTKMPALVQERTFFD